MIKVLYFARYRDVLGQAEEQLPFSETLSSVEFLIQHLSQRGPLWLETLTDKQTLVAVNQAITNTNHTLHDGDEIAFFPPVTGG